MKAAAIRWASVLALAACAATLTQCVPSRRVNVVYQPPLVVPREPDPKLPPVVVVVADKRATPVVGEPIGAFGEKEGKMLSESGAPNALHKAFDIELRNRGFAIGGGGNEVRVTLSFFQSQYVHPLFWTRVVASIGIDVAVRRPNGTLVYDRFIVGQSEREAETHFESDQTWASDALNAAMKDAIAQAFSDSDFLAALSQR